MIAKLQYIQINSSYFILDICKFVGKAYARGRIGYTFRPGHNLTKPAHEL